MDMLAFLTLTPCAWFENEIEHKTTNELCKSGDQSGLVEGSAILIIEDVVEWRASGAGRDVCFPHKTLIVIKCGCYGVLTQLVVKFHRDDCSIRLDVQFAVVRCLGTPCSKKAC